MDAGKIAEYPNNGKAEKWIKQKKEKKRKKKEKEKNPDLISYEHTF